MKLIYLDCQRECDDGPSQRCVYDFHIEHYYTMSKACQDCPNKLDECELHHCITADGVGRGVVSINRQIPAPSIQVFDPLWNSSNSRIF